MNAPDFPIRAAELIVGAALDEDFGGGGDITTTATLPRPLGAAARVVAREATIVAGLPLIPLVLGAVSKRLGQSARSEAACGDGARVPAATTLARIEGDAAVVLGAERVILNLMSRLCGVARLTAAAVDEVAGTGCRIADTRKTTPGLRALERYAVAVAGGENHRSSLAAQILVKDNHKQLAGGLAVVLDRLRSANLDLAAVEIEVETLEEFDLALAAGSGWILLDNMPLEQIREATRRARGRTRLEVSGGLRPGRLRPLAELGINRLSLGLLTHGAPAVDLALDID